MDMGLSTVIGAGLGGTSSLLQNVFNNSNSKRAVRRQLDANKQLADYQYNLNMSAWREQNAYNTPTAQMQRYKDAGLNPNLVVSQGNSGNAGAPPTYDRPEAGNSFVPTKLEGLSSILNHVLDFSVRDAQVENMKMQNNLLAGQIDKTRAEENSIIMNTLNNMLGYSDKYLDYSKKKRLFDYNLGVGMLELESKARQFMLDRQYQAKDRGNASSLLESQKDYEKLRYELNKEGLETAPYYLRYIYRHWDQIKENLGRNRNDPAKGLHQY